MDNSQQDSEYGYDGNLTWSNANPMMKTSLLGLVIGLMGLVLYSFISATITPTSVAFLALTLGSYFVFAYYRHRQYGLGEQMSFIGGLVMTLVIGFLTVIAFYPPEQLGNRISSVIVLAAILLMLLINFEEGLRDYLKRYETQNEAEPEVN